jgi:hypothetical protein
VPRFCHLLGVIAVLDPTGLETLVLPLSGWVFQWRADGWWRELAPDQWRAELDGVFTPSGDEWVQWAGTVHRLAKGGWSDAPRPFVVYSELVPGLVPQVVLADGGRPPIVRLGRIWVCEWVSLPQPATVTVGAEEWVVPFDRRPHYLYDPDE